MKNNKKITIFICIILVMVSGMFYVRNIVNSTDASDTMAQYSVLSDEKIMENEVLDDKMSDNTALDGEKLYTSAVSTISVYICGAVKSPGVYDFLEGSRICDAVERAGGFKKSAAKMKINLASTLSDGEQIIIPTKKQAAKRRKSADNVSGTNIEGNTGAAGSNDTTDKSGLVNINIADKSELMTLSGIGESKADAIIAYRQKSSFSKIEDIKNVSGIKDGVFNKIKDNITI